MKRKKQLISCYKQLKRRAGVLLVIFLLIFGIFSLPDLTYSDGFENNDPDHIRVIIKYKTSDKLQVIDAPSGSIDEYVKKLNQEPDIEYAEKDERYHASLIPSDSFFGNQWYLKKIKAVESWDIKRDSPNITIAVIDSGVQISHPDIKDNVWENPSEIAGNGIDDDKNGFVDDKNGWDFINNVSDPSPKFAEGFTEAGVLHGTIVAGVAAASGNNAFGVTGVTWQAKIMALKALDDKGEGSTSQVVNAIDYAIKNGADIINLSFVGLNYSRSMDEAVKRAYDAGIILVAAAGNEQHEGQGFDLDETPMYPACYDGPNGENRILGVAATDGIDQKALFSSYGNKCVDISAPGYSIFSTVVYAPEEFVDQRTFNKHYDGYWSGTSMAAPMVSGAIALIEETNPFLNRDDILGILLDNSDNIERLNPAYFGQLGRGRLNVFRSLEAAKRLFDEKNEKIMYTPRTIGSSTLVIADFDNKNKSEFSFSDRISADASIASGNFDLQGNGDLLIGAMKGEKPYVRIYNDKKELIKEFLAYGANFTGGVNVAAADINDDGRDEIITGAGSGGGPHVRIFNHEGRLLSQFFAYDPRFRGGVNVAAADVNSDGLVEIITGAGIGGGPQVRIFRTNGSVVSQFFAYDPKFRGGVKVTVASLDKNARNGHYRIVTAPGPGGGPHIRIFNYEGNILNQFFAYNQNVKNGLSIAAGDLNKDGIDEIVTGAGPSGTSHIRVFTAQGTIISSFFAYPESFLGGVNVGVIDR